MSGSSLLSTKSAYFPADESLDLPGIVVQVIAGVDSYLVWAGATSQIPLSGNKAREAEIEALLQRGRLGYDWACSMGNVKASIPVSGTTLLRTSKDGVALPLSQRLAHRFKKQIFVSIDMDPNYSINGKGPAVGLAIEKAIVSVLSLLEDEGRNS